MNKSTRAASLFATEYAVLTALSNSGCQCDNVFQLLFDIKSRTETLLFKTIKLWLFFVLIIHHMLVIGTHVRIYSKFRQCCNLTLGSNLKANCLPAKDLRDQRPLAYQGRLLMPHMSLLEKDGEVFHGLFRDSVLFRSRWNAVEAKQLAAKHMIIPEEIGEQVIPQQQVAETIHGLRNFPRLVAMLLKSWFEVQWILNFTVHVEWWLFLPILLYLIFSTSFSTRDTFSDIFWIFVAQLLYS